MKNPSCGTWLWSPSWNGTDDQTARIVCFRKDFSLEELPVHCTMQITADTRYKLYVNGTFAQFGPSRGDTRIWYVDRVDLSPWLRPGKNTLLIQVLRYPADGSLGNHGMFRTAMPGLYIKEEIPADGTGWTCRIDRTTVFTPEEEGFVPLWIHENAGCTGADSADIFSGSGWEPAAVISPEQVPPVLRPEALADRTIPFMRRTPHTFTLPVTEVPARSRVSFVLDAGEEMCAFLRLALSGGRGARVELLQSECYVTEKGKGDRTDAVHGHLEGYADIYTVSGREQEIYEPFWFRTFRYLQVTVQTAEEPLALLALDYEETGYPLDVRTEVRTSDESLAGIWDISLRTLRRCMHETYVDCPFYEQLQYIMDTRSQILYTYAVSADDRLARKAIDDFRRAQRPDGLLNCSYPNRNVNVIPGFSLYYILILHDHMMYFGDPELIRENLTCVKRILTFFDTHRTPEGLVGTVGGENGKAPFWSFIDWAIPWLPTTGMPTAGLQGPLTMESLLYLLGLQRAAELAAYAGDEPFAVLCRERAESLLRAIRRSCLDENGVLTDGPGVAEYSQHCQVFGILTGTLTPEEGKRNLLRSMEDPAFTQCTVAMCYYLFRALEQTGLYEYTDRYWNIWRKMLADHCTTCVESEGYSRSECHAWGALALYELPSVVLGVRPAAPGYEKIRISPVPGYLTSASGTVCTPKGSITVSWKLQDGRLHTTADAAPEILRRILR